MCVCGVVRLSVCSFGLGWDLRPLVSEPHLISHPSDSSHLCRETELLDFNHVYGVTDCVGTFNFNSEVNGSRPDGNRAAETLEAVL